MRPLLFSLLLTACGADIAAPSSNEDELLDAIAALQETIEALEEEVERLEGTVGDLGGTIGALEAEITRLRDELDDLTDAIDDLQGGGSGGSGGEADADTDTDADTDADADADADTDADTDADATWIGTKRYDVKQSTGGVLCSSTWSTSGVEAPLTGCPACDFVFDVTATAALDECGYGSITYRMAYAPAYLGGVNYMLVEYGGRFYPYADATFDGTNLEYTPYFLQYGEYGTDYIFDGYGRATINGL